MKRLVLLIMLLVLALPLATAVDLYIEDIEIQEDVIINRVRSTAMSFIETDEEPISYDLKIRPIQANFNEDKTKYVIVDPVFGTVFGFRDDSLRSNTEEENYNSEQRRDIANEMFDELNGNTKGQLNFHKEENLGNNIYRYSWQRYYEDELILDDFFYVDVDAGNGEIISWELAYFRFQRSSYSKVKEVEFGTDTAKRLARNEYNFNINNEPVLVYYKDKNVYLFENEGDYLLINAITGENVFEGKLELQIPEAYSYGSNIVTKYEESRNASLISMSVFFIIFLLIFVFVIHRKKKSNKKKSKESSEEKEE